jgi:hypothetical protein
MKKTVIVIGAVVGIPLGVTLLFKAYHIMYSLISKCLITFLWVGAVLAGVAIINKNCLKKETEGDGESAQEARNHLWW